MAYSTVASTTKLTDTFEIAREDLQALEVPAQALITNLKFLSSYNWIEAPEPTPTIAVPGSPGLWKVHEAPQKIKQDSGLIYIAQNAARHPESPLEPLFRALYTADPSFDIRSTDLVTDRNNVRKLLSFVDPTSNKNGLEAFTIQLEVVKDTLILCRDETKTFEILGPKDFRGFGHEFEKFYTTPQISDSTGHHRIITYNFDGLNVIVRHEVDGYVEANNAPPARFNTDPQDGITTMLGALSLSSPGRMYGVDGIRRENSANLQPAYPNLPPAPAAEVDLTVVMKQVARDSEASTSSSAKEAPKYDATTQGKKTADLSKQSHSSNDKEDRKSKSTTKKEGNASVQQASPLSIAKPVSTSKLTIKKEGHAISQDLTLEIKTRTTSKPIPFEEVAAQLWVSQTPKLVRAYHERGTFRKPKVETIITNLQNWEMRKQKELKTLAALIWKVMSAAKGLGGRAVLKYNNEGDKLIVSKVEGPAMLAKDLYAKWDEESIPRVESISQGASST